MDSLEKLHRHTGSDQPQVSIQDLDGYTGSTTTYLRGDGTFATPTSFSAHTSPIELKASADTERSNGDQSDAEKLNYHKYKEITMNISGTANVYFELATGNTSQSVYGRIYKNDVAVGTERTTTAQYSSFANYSEDISFVSGDKIQLYIKTATPNPNNVSAWCRNFRIYYEYYTTPTVNTN